MTDHTTDLTQDDVLLLIADGATGSFPLDPIRVMKGAFLVSQIGRPSWRPLFRFRPYHFGPFDSAVYAARDRLLSAGLLQATTDGRYDSYELSNAGRARVAEVEARIGERSASWLRQVGRYVTSRSFRHLLDEIYERYPDFASHTVMR